MALAAQNGHRVVLVVATRGERGEPTPGVLGEGEHLWERRMAETFESARLLGVARVEFLGYVDSGMMGESDNNHPYSFWQADVEHAAHRLQAILEEENADLLTVYDDFGGYGHPDHIQVHRVGMRAAELAATPRVLQGTMNQDAIKRSITEVAAQMAEAGIEPPDGAPAPEDLDTTTFGKPEAELTHAIDVSSFIGVKREAMRAHASQIAEDSWFLSLDDAAYLKGFGTEWFIDAQRPRPADAAFRTDIWD